MATIKKGWIGPLKQSTKGKRPWVCDYACPLSVKKKRKKIAEAGANKKDRERLYHDFGRSLTDGRFVTSETATFGDALDRFERWCEQRHRTQDRMSAGRLAKIRDGIRVHLRPDLGKMLLSEITSPLIQNYVYKKAESYRTTYFELYGQIKLALERAVWERLIGISPLDVQKVRLPEYPASRTNMPTIEEGRAFWHALLHEGRTNARISEHCNITRLTSVSLAMFGGMGCGEMCGLKWNYVDFIEQSIWVEHSYSRYRDFNGERLKGPKVPSRHRFIPMSLEMNEWLTKTAQRDGNPRDGFVFRPEPESYNNRWGHTEGGHLLRALTGQLQAAQMRLGFVKEDGKAKWTLHDLRRYAGSVWLELGYPMEDVSNWLGHEKIETTQRYYVRPFKKQSLKRGREMMTKLSALHRMVPDDQAALPSPRYSTFMRH